MNKKKILIVEDEPDILKLLTIYLNDSGYEASFAINGKEGLEKATENKPDLILLDYNMPVMNGPEMLENLRSNLELQDIPIIMLTALCDQENIDAVHDYNILDYVPKPFDSIELCEKIENALEAKPV
jgi:DNA-binding response OmpR family regulator